MISSWVLSWPHPRPLSASGEGSAQRGVRLIGRKPALNRETSIASRIRARCSIPGCELPRLPFLIALALAAAHDVPLAPGTLAGLMNLRGQIIAAIDLRRQLGAAGAEQLFLSGTDEAPAPYRKLIEEYYRQLAKEKKK